VRPPKTRAPATPTSRSDRFKASAGDELAHDSDSHRTKVRSRRPCLASDRVRCVDLLGSAGTHPRHDLQSGHRGIGAGAANLATNAAANPLTNQLHIAAYVLETFLLPLSVLGLAGMALRRSPWLATIGGGLGLLGWLPWSALAAQDDLTYQIAQAVWDLGCVERTLLL
jgi:hypothetical protein